MSVSLHTLAERPDLGDDPGRTALFDVWPEFAKHDPVVNSYIGRAIAEHPNVQVVAWEDELQRVVAEGNTVPVRWPKSPPPGGVDWALSQRYEEDGEPTTLCALQVMVAPERQGTGLSARMLKRMTLAAREAGLDALVAPVRPTLKPRYPLVPIERYVEWRRDDGQLVDPWLRTHERLGATVLGVAAESMVIDAARSSWREWTGMEFPDDGAYVVPGALVPVEFSGDRGLYVEPNVWMRHPLP